LIRATTSLPELQGLTVADLNEVARKYLKPEDALPVVVTPLQTTGKASPTRPALRESALAPAH
jgi:predicted Zn-dependent peptidase